MKKVSSKIASAIAVCCILVSILIGFVSIYGGSQQITMQSKENLQLMAENEANKFSRTIEKLESTTRNIVMTIEATADASNLGMDEEYIAEYLNEIDPIIRKSARSVEGNISAYVVFDPNLTGKLSQVVYALTPEGNFAKLSDEMLSENATREDFITPGNPMTQWFHDAVDQEDGVWSDPKFNPLANMDLITFSKPVYVNDQFIGVVAMDIDFNVLRNLVNNITAFDSGYAFLLNNRFDSLYHPIIQEAHNLAEIENGSLKSITEYMQQYDSGIQEYTLSGEEKIMGYAHLANGSILGIVAPSHEILAKTKGLTSLIIILTILCIVIALIIGFIIARSIARPITHLKELMKKAEEGDLTVIASVKSKDEIGQLAQSFNFMLEEQRNMIHKVIKAARLVSTNVEKVGVDINNITSSTQQMGEAANEVASSASSTSETIVDVTSSLEEMDATIELIAQNSYDASKKGKETVHITEDGKVTVNQAASEMDAIKENMLDIINVIEGLGSATVEIGKIISIIEDIAEQTNLLSLNASIEAARAGEYGRGFSVVAEAIGGLAMKSGEATKDIAKLIQEIQGTVYGAIDHTKNSADKIRDGVELVKQTENIFESILGSIKTTTKLIDEIAVSTEEQTKTSKTIMESVTNVNDMSMHVSSAIQEQVATIEEIMNAMERVNILTQYKENEQSQEYMQNLTYQAQSLLQLVSRFKVD